MGNAEMVRHIRDALAAVRAAKAFAIAAEHQSLQLKADDGAETVQHLAFATTEKLTVATRELEVLERDPGGLLPAP